MVASGAARRTTWAGRSMTAACVSVVIRPSLLSAGPWRGRATASASLRGEERLAVLALDLLRPDLAALDGSLDRQRHVVEVARELVAAPVGPVEELEHLGHLLGLVRGLVDQDEGRAGARPRLCAPLTDERDAEARSRAPVGVCGRGGEGLVVG